MPIAMAIRLTFRQFACLSVLALSVACGASAPPTLQQSKTQSAIRGAEVAGAEDTPKAKLHLKMAKDHLANAEQLISEEEYDDAALVLRRAEADAELAIALAKEEQARDRAEDLQKKVQELKREME
jgi:hypothetical protein